MVRAEREGLHTEGQPLLGGGIEAEGQGSALQRLTRWSELSQYRQQNLSANLHVNCHCGRNGNFCRLAKEEIASELKPLAMTAMACQKSFTRFKVAQKGPDARRREARNEAYFVCTPQFRSFDDDKADGPFSATPKGTFR
jgi:hypothetical protein